MSSLEDKIKDKIYRIDTFKKSFGEQKYFGDYIKNGKKYSSLMRDYEVQKYTNKIIKEIIELVSRGAK